ncbi:MFS general substrate transporter [Westerdykella ornata]|uniref:MFS general substrate transporter n=1 Tax=Westerdykella ornata TaxID=318751 RepID=A0A6A6JUP6_WESOR|nr:MFS general substrate transporter [Westerdykella ornata]KAF2280107.1 MFS general substrate transporter [Westerdykella ornata]
MFLTRTRTRPDPNHFPTAQLFLLALVRVAEPIALTSIFPYAWKLVQHYHVGSEANAAFYAGILISAFSLAEACTGMHWGAVSDRVGRKPVLLLGCMGTITSLMLVGLAPNFWVALLGRIVGGLLNGNVGVIQTMVAELVVNPAHEPKAYAIMPFVWSLGTIIGPSIGGCFAEPAENYPHLFPPTGFFAKFPFVLPNIICSSLLVLAIIAGYFLLDETHPDKQPWSRPQDHRERRESVASLQMPGGNMNAPDCIASGCYGTFDQVSTERDQTWRVTSNGTWVNETKSNDNDNNTSEKAITRPVVMFVVALGIFTYHSMTYDHLLPIFLQDKRADDISSFATSNPFAGGLGLSIQDVGIIMSVNGIIALFVQAVIFPLLASWIGVWQLLVLVTIGHPLAYFIVPYLPLLPPSLVYPGIYACLAIRNLLAIVAYPLLLIMIKEAVPSSNHLGKINGLAASTGAACRSVASPIAGFLYGKGIEMRFTPLAWWASSVVALMGTFQIPWLAKEARGFTGAVNVQGRGCLGCLGRKRETFGGGREVRIVVEGEAEVEGETTPLVAGGRREGV